MHSALNYIKYILTFNLYFVRQYSITESQVNEKWRIFFIRNLLCYTKLFYLAIKRFTYIDICSPRHSIMVSRTLKVNKCILVFLNNIYLINIIS